MTTNSSTEPVDRVVENWKYPYVAGAVDFGSAFQASINKASDRSVGYAVKLGIIISKKDRRVIDFVDQFCLDHGLSPKRRETETSYRVELMRQEDVGTFLALLLPYLLVRHEQSALIIEDLLPALDAEKQSSKEGFYEIVGIIDRIRRAGSGHGDVKYDQAYFRDLWDLW